MEGYLDERMSGWWHVVVAIDVAARDVAFADMLLVLLLRMGFYCCH